MYYCGRYLYITDRRKVLALMDPEYNSHLAFSN